MPRFDAYAQGTPCYVELLTPDPAAAAEAYAELFGWSVAEVDLGPAGVYRPVTVDGLSVAGISGPPPSLVGAPARWDVHLAVDDVDEVAARVGPLGGSVRAGPFDVADLGRMAVTTDPTGAWVNLWQAGSSPGTQWADEVGTPVWNELVSPDLETAERYYADLLGVEWSTMPADGATYDVLTAGGRHCGGAVSSAGGAVPPHWNVYFQVADVDAAVERATGLGFTVATAAREMAGVGRLARLTDPQGGGLWVMRP